MAFEGKVRFEIVGNETTTTADVLGLTVGERRVRFTDLKIVSENARLESVDLKATVSEGEGETKAIAEFEIEDTQIDALEELERIVRDGMKRADP
jgi:hypothetical protein